jgi:hypothetical protein
MDNTYGDQTLSVVPLSFNQIVSAKLLTMKNEQNKEIKRPTSWLLLLPPYRKSDSENVNAAQITKALGASQPIFRLKKAVFPS